MRRQTHRLCLTPALSHGDFPAPSTMKVGTAPSESNAVLRVLMVLSQVSAPSFATKCPTANGNVRIPASWQVATTIAPGRFLATWQKSVKTAGRLAFDAVWSAGPCTRSTPA